jgi:hypothetical protein
MEWLKSKIEKNKLPFSYEFCVAYMESVKDQFPDYDEYKLFYAFLRDQVWLSVECRDEETRSLIMGLEIRGKNTTFYEFNSDEEYRRWLDLRMRLYEGLDHTTTRSLRILNYFEMSIMNFITDIQTSTEYVAYKGSNKKNFVKLGHYSSESKTTTFMKYIKEIFNKGIHFKPLKNL